MNSMLVSHDLILKRRQRDPSLFQHIRGRFTNMRITEQGAVLPDHEHGIFNPK